MYAPRGQPVQQPDAERGQAPPQGTAIVVFGIPLEDERLAFLTQRVLTASLIVALLIVVMNTIDLVAARNSGSISVSLAAILCGLSIPACGYFGAKNRDRNLIMFFCGCEFLQTLLSTCTLVLAVAAMATGAARTGSILSFIVVLISLPVNVYAFYYANALYQHPYFTGIATPPAFMGTTAHTQPTVQGTATYPGGTVAYPAGGVQQAYPVGQQPNPAYYAQSQPPPAAAGGAGVYAQPQYQGPPPQYVPTGAAYTGGQPPTSAGAPPSKNPYQQ